MYVSRIIYEGCNSFQDANSQGSSIPDSLFNLTQNYYYVLPQYCVLIDTPIDNEVVEDENLI